MKRSLLTFLAIIVGIVVFAYGFEVTKVDLSELGKPERQTSLTRIMRALARPDFFEYEQREVTVDRGIYVPCPSGAAPTVAEGDQSGPYLVAPPCADPNAQVVIEGFNFEPNSTGPLNFIPPSGVSLQMGRIESDSSGHFSLTVKMRNRTNDEAQTLRAVTRTSVGGAHLSQNGRETINKIIETVFMALLATVIGTLLSIPVSFFAARNLMQTVTSPLPSMALSTIGAPIGVWLGATLAGLIAALSSFFTGNLFFHTGGIILTPFLLLGVMRWVLPGQEESEGVNKGNWLRWLALAVMVALLLFVLYLLSDLALALGQMLAPTLGDFAFLGDFLAKLGEILRICLVPVCALIGAGILVNLGGHLGQNIVERVSPATGKIVNLVLGAAAGVVIGALIGAAAGWFYEISDWIKILVMPGAVGAVLGLLVAARIRYNDSLPVGLAIYNITRTVLNALRSVEALIMVIVFAVWVGIGPFAGVLALGLHTVAALAKLYSEQVENIMEGPLEAVLATGANRLQMIRYAVIPQIVPPYISFTMYRWDINVRMSTIIGFAGGGGIGFLLQQNINLLNYRGASAQIFAIAIVVSAMDYLSSALRRRAI